MPDRHYSDVYCRADFDLPPNRQIAFSRSLQGLVTEVGDRDAHTSSGTLRARQNPSTNRLRLTDATTTISVPKFNSRKCWRDKQSSTMVARACSQSSIPSLRLLQGTRGPLLSCFRSLCRVFQRHRSVSERRCIDTYTSTPAVRSLGLWRCAVACLTGPPSGECMCSG